MMLPLFFAFSAIVIRLALFYLGYENQDSARYLILMHILLILLSVFFSALNHAKANPDKRHFTNHLKIGFKGGSVYTIIITGFLMLFYKVINEDTFTAKREFLIAQQIEAGGANLDESAIEAVRTNIESFFTVFNYCTITFIGFLVITFMYSAGVALLLRFMQRNS